MKTRSKRWYLNYIRNSGISFRFVAFRLIMLFLSLMIISCTKKDEDTDEEQYPDNNSIVEDVYAKAPEDQYTIMDVRRIPIDEYLLQIDNDELQEALESIQQFNDHMDHPGQRPDSVTLKSSALVDYTEKCEEKDGYTECLYTYYYSGYKHELHAKYYYSPYLLHSEYKWKIFGIQDGIDYGNGYTISESEYWPFFSSDIEYNYPEPEESAGEPLYKYEVVSYDELVTLYAPWNTVDVSVTDYFQTTYLYDYGQQENHEWGVLWTRIIGYSDMIITIQHYSLRLEGLYVAWVGTYSFDTRDGGWISYDDYGNVTNYGDW